MKYSDKSQREYALMHISEEDRQSPKFSLPHNIDILFRALMELHLSDSAQIVYNGLVEEEERLEQKGFVMVMVDKLWERATTLSYSSARSVHENAAESNARHPIHKGRRRVNHKHPQLPPDRLEVPTADHFMTLSEKRSIPKYCSSEIVCFKANGGTGTPPG